MTHVRSANKPRKRYAPLLRIVSLLKRLICKYVVSTLSDIQAQEIQNLWRTAPLNHAASSVNLEKMDFQKEERNLHKVFEVNNEG